jgi:hypothetical protein
VGLVGVAQDRDRWRTLVNAIMNLRVHRSIELVSQSAENTFCCEKDCM